MILRFAILVFAFVSGLTSMAAAATQAEHFGLVARSRPRAYLRMPATADGELPRLLSETGAFSETPAMKFSNGLIPYDLVVSFWSDGSAKSRWISVPNGKIVFSPTGEWAFPAGTVFVKTFELPTDATNPAIRRRLETRLLVRDNSGSVYGVTYKWRVDGSDADLLPDSYSEEIAVKAADGQMHTQIWYYPSRQDCLICHNARAGRVLGLKARQMNKPYAYPGGIVDNQLRAWNHIGLFSRDISDAEIERTPSLAASDDGARTIEDRGRSYLDANCAPCHRPGGTVANFDARYETALEQQALVDGPVLINEGLDKPRVLAPHDIWRSVAYMRMNTNDDIRMPPLARQTIDERGVQLMHQWIDSMPGRAVLPPPAIHPTGGMFTSPIEVTLEHPEPDADIRYTLDGTVPGADDLRYDKPILLAAPTVLRTRAFKAGYTRSITAQQVFIIGK